MALIKPQGLNFTPQSPFSPNANQRRASVYDRIDYKSSLGLPNTIVICGGGQTGKTTTGNAICQHYDPSYNLWYSERDLFKTLDTYKAMRNQGIETYRGKWNLFDEPETVLGSVNERNDPRAVAIIQTIAMWGELKQNLVLCFPDIGDLFKKIYRNITMVIYMECAKIGGVKTHIAHCWRIYKPPYKKDWEWAEVGWWPVPKTEMPPEYLKRKYQNFEDTMQRLGENIAIEENKRKFLLEKAQKSKNPYEF